MNDPAELSRVRITRRRMSNLLCGWSIASIIAGVVIYWITGDQDSASRKFAEAVSAQFVIWGAIDLVFATFGILQVAKADRTPIDGEVASRELGDRDKLVRTLRFNRKLNWLWVACGIVLLASAAGAAWRGAEAASVASLLGHGAGVIVQGGFLFWFDRVFLKKLTLIG